MSGRTSSRQLAALESQLRCDRYRKKRRLIVFRDITMYPEFAKVSTERVLARALEWRARIRRTGKSRERLRGEKARR